MVERHLEQAAEVVERRREQAAEESTLTGRRAFGELSRAAVEPRLERAAEESGGAVMNR